MIQIYGKNVVREAVRAHHPFSTLYLDSTLKDKEAKWIDIVKKENPRSKIVFCDTKKLDSLEKGLHQGYIMLAEDYKLYSLNEVIDSTKKQIFLMLDGLEDPHNLGAILRTADATKTDAIIIPKNRSVQITPTVVKVSTGAIEYVKIIQVNNMNSTIDELKKKGFWIYGADMDGSITDDQLDFQTSMGLVVGSEGFGISRLTKQKCDVIVQIPMVGNVNSLNASVSASILLYDIFRKR